MCLPGNATGPYFNPRTSARYDCSCADADLPELFQSTYLCEVRPQVGGVSPFDFDFNPRTSARYDLFTFAV